MFGVAPKISMCEQNFDVWSSVKGCGALYWCVKCIDIVKKKKPVPMLGLTDSLDWPTLTLLLSKLAHPSCYIIYLCCCCCCSCCCCCRSCFCRCCCCCWIFYVVIIFLRHFNFFFSDRSLGFSSHTLSTSGFEGSA